jgi:glycosyltransferase involved in cell wall biosynthesis
VKILLVSHSDLEGGAARATYRLHQGLVNANYSAPLLVQTKRSKSDLVIATRHHSGMGHAISEVRQSLNRAPAKFYRGSNQSLFSSQWQGDGLCRQIDQIAPDIINLHWVNSGYLQIETLAKLKRPIVWTLHDMWAFTGGCHYDQACGRYTQACGQCPQLGSHWEHDLSRWNWWRKAKAWQHVDLTLVTPSRWLADCASKSSLFCDRRIEWIPNGIDTEVYRPIDRAIARDILQLPQDKRLILSGSLRIGADKRKGLHLLQPALQQLSQQGWQQRAELVVFGASMPTNPPDLGLKTHYLGTLADDQTLALLYSAADVFVTPSQQDNLPNTVVEALACGTPSVAFRLGGMPDLIDHQINGYLARPFEIEDLVQGLAWALETSQDSLHVAAAAREKALEAFSLQTCTQNYMNLFSDILSRF